MQTKIFYLTALLFAATFLTACGGGSDNNNSDAVSNLTVENGAAAVDVGLFMANALATIPTTEDCTLSNGVASTCYRIMVVGLPVDHEEGPYCPPFTTSTADEGGIWFDGNNVYDVDGDFILNLSTIYNDDKWLLHDGNGNVSIGSVVNGGGGLPGANGNCLEGFASELDNGQPTTTVLIPAVPVARAAVAGLGRGEVGIALNGVKLEGPAPVEQILSGTSIGVFDDCAGHLNPFEGYHYHGGNGCSEVVIQSGHAAAFGYALDGYLIYSMLDSAGNEATGLDSCRGHSDDALGYHYHAASVAENLFIGCYRGETVQNDDAGAPAVR